MVDEEMDIQVLETQFNDDDANKAAAQVQAVIGGAHLAARLRRASFSAVELLNGSSRRASWSRQIAASTRLSWSSLSSKARHFRANIAAASG